MVSRIVSYVVALMVLIAVAPAAAQYIDPGSCSMAEFACQQAVKERNDKAAADDAYCEDQALQQKAER